MYEKDGILYAGEPAPLIRVKTARPIGTGYELLLTFTNGEKRVFDMEQLLHFPCYQPLKDKEVFRQVYVDHGVTVWNDDEIDVSPESLYEDSVPLTEATIA